MLAVLGQVLARADYMPPLQTSGTGGVVVVSWIADSVRGSGVDVGDRVLAVDGVPVNDWFRQRGWEALRPGVQALWEVEKSDGARRTVPLLPVSREVAGQHLMLPILVASFAVGFAYLALGGLVWRLKPDKDESWAFLLFCSVMAMELFSAVHTYDALFGYERMLANLPFLGATTFHLFTTFPVEPAWVARYPFARPLGYVLAAAAALPILFGVTFGAVLRGLSLRRLRLRHGGRRGGRRRAGPRVGALPRHARRAARRRGVLGRDAELRAGARARFGAPVLPRDVPDLPRR